MTEEAPKQILTSTGEQVQQNVLNAFETINARVKASDSSAMQAKENAWRTVDNWACEPDIPHETRMARRAFERTQTGLDKPSGPQYPETLIERSPQHAGGTGHTKPITLSQREGVGLTRRGKAPRDLRTEE